MSLKIAELFSIEGKIAVVTGGSRGIGAAIATLGALDFKHRLSGKDIGLFVTGSPRVGDGRFAAFLKKFLPDAVRAVFRNDPVTGVPFKFLGYKHIDTLLQLGKRAWFKINFKEHNISKYIKEIKAMEE